MQNYSPIPLHNPFGSPVYYEDTVTSTMDISRKLAEDGSPHGTIIAAGFQTSGRGRIKGRVWEMNERQGLAFTILLRYLQTENIPKALTLRIGLAVSLAIEELYPSLKIKIKWPNDILIREQGAGSGEWYKKAGGILCEADGGNVFAGIGINVFQKDFPDKLSEKAVSIAPDTKPQNETAETDLIFSLLEKILFYIHAEFEDKNGWKTRADLESRLYKKNEQVFFEEGAAGSGKYVSGILHGINDEGELLIIPDGEKTPRRFTTGELKFN